MPRLAVLLAAWLLVFGASPVEAEGPVHLVQRGDTLMAISRLYGVSLQALVEANGIANPNLIYVGQRLTIPAAGQGALPAQPAAPPAQPPTPVSGAAIHLVAPGETLFSIARRYGSGVEEIAAANGLINVNLIFTGQRLTIPPAGALTGDPKVNLSTIVPAQGSTLVVTIPGATEATGVLAGKPVPFVQAGEASYALIGFAPWETVGVRPLKIRYRDADGETRQASLSLTLQRASFPLERWPAASGLPSIPPQVVVAERERLAAIFGTVGAQRLWSGAFGLPLRSYRLTSAFGAMRAFGAAPASWWHEGLDMAAPTGTGVYAPAAGVVVLAETLQVRGGAVVLDHGWGVHSGYWHLSEVLVEAGAAVETGTLLGRVGSTGLSTGPHLHWEVRVLNAPVDPQQWLAGVLP